MSDGEVIVIDGYDNTSNCKVSTAEHMQEREGQRLYAKQWRDKACAAGIQAFLRQPTSAAPTTATAISDGIGSDVSARAAMPAVVFRTVPGLCDASLLQLQRDRKQIELTYFDVEVTVERVKLEDVPAPGAEGAGEHLLHGGELRCNSLGRHLKASHF